MENKGYIHVYTGNGKGKTTAAFGLAIRVLCAGGSVFIGQFVKNMKYNETKIEHLFNNVRIQQFGRGCFIEKKPAQEDIDAAYAGLESCKQIRYSNKIERICQSHAINTPVRPVRCGEKFANVFHVVTVLFLTFYHTAEILSREKSKKALTKENDHAII